MGFNFPNSPSVGTTWLAPNGTTYIWDGEAWRITNDPYASGVVISDTPPANPFHGMLWWESDTGNTFIYFDDGDSAQWVQFNSAPPADKLVSLVQDMSAFFTATSFVINSKADGTGSNVFTINDVGQAYGSYVRVTETTALVHVNKTAAAGYAGIAGLYNGSTRWLMQLGDGVAESGGNAGSNFAISCYTDAGANLSSPLLINRNNGLVTFPAGNVRQTSTGTGSYNHFVAAMRLGDQPAITWHAQAAAVVIDYAGPANDHGMLISSRLSGTAAAIGFMHGSGGAYTGSITNTVTGTTYNTTSDERLKNFGAEMTGDEAAAIIRADPVRHFTWKETGQDAVGWSAQKSYAISEDLAQPPADHGMRNLEPGDPGFIPWGMDQARRTPYLWAALASALDKIDALEARLAALEGAA